MPHLYLGLMSGTSMDAADAALVDFSADQPKLIATQRTKLTAELRAALLALCVPGPNEIERMAELDARLGELFADSALALLKKSGVKPVQVHAIGSHGQTVRHQPSGPYPFSLQIGNPALIAQRTGITTVADFRRADIAAGGQGAPLVPAFHNAMFRSAEHDRAVVNIGGIANITILHADPSQDVRGFDTGPGNVLLDAWAERHLGKRMDEDGRFAASGKVHEGLLSALLNDDYFSLAPPKSTGREHFNIAWLDAILHQHSEHPLSPGGEGGSEGGGERARCTSHAVRTQRRFHHRGDFALHTRYKRSADLRRRRAQRALDATSAGALKTLLRRIHREARHQPGLGRGDGLCLACETNAARKTG